MAIIYAIKLFWIPKSVFDSALGSGARFHASAGANKSKSASGANKSKSASGANKSKSAKSTTPLSRAPDPFASPFKKSLYSNSKSRPHGSSVSLESAASHVSGVRYSRPVNVQRLPSDSLDGCTGVVAEHSDPLDGCTGVVAEHSNPLDGCAGVVAEHSNTLDGCAGGVVDHSNPLENEQPDQGGSSSSSAADSAEPSVRSDGSNSVEPPGLV